LQVKTGSSSVENVLTRIEDMATHYSVEEPVSPGGEVPSRPAATTVALTALIAAGPAAFTVYLAFRSGGYFAGAPAIAAIVLAVALVLRLMLAESPFEGFGPAMTWATIGLGAFTLWTLLSAFWSHAPAQALIAFDRSLMLWLALVLFGSFRWSRERLLWAVRLLAAAMVVVAILGLITRLLPNVHEIPESFERDRLSYPISYWNGLGAFVAVAILLCCGLATRREEPSVSKALAAAAMPILAVTLYFTFSRGAIGVLLIGLVAFVALAARRELLTGFVAIVPPTAIAVLLALATHTLSTEHYAVPAGVTEGHKLAWELLALAAAAGILRVLLLPVDRRLARIDLSPQFVRRGWIVVGAIVAVAIVGVGIAASGRIGDDFEKFTETQGIEDTGELQHRLTDINNNGRIAQWKLALDRFDAEPLHGDGAGTFARAWAAEAEDESRIVDSHSLYLGVMAELGLPGLIFLAIALIAILVATARRIFGPERILFAAIFAAMLTWVVHASVDWDWQLPALGFFVFALGGMAIAADPGAGERDGTGLAARLSGRTARIALSLCALALVVSPALVAISQGYLNSAVKDFEKGNCAGASRKALDAIHTLSVRPDPYQLLGFCDSREGEHALAVSLLETAIARDRGEWESYYGLAVVQAAAGRNPRAAALKAYEMAPHEPLAEEGVELFSHGNPQIWKRRAQSARLPVS
jgi:O-antigen ligase